MRTETINIYLFEELSDSSKKKAREWWRDCERTDPYYHEAVYEDAIRMGALMGIEIDTRYYKTVGGGQGSKPNIYYSGFWSQGDGASFDGSYSYKKGAAKAIAKETNSTETKLMGIAERLQEVQKRNFYQLTARTKVSGHYSHSSCMAVDVERSDEKEMTSDAEDIITECLRDFADWIYNQLEKEYDYTMSDENVDERIRINEYEFYEDGGRV